MSCAVRAMVKLDAKNWTVHGELMVSFFLAGPISDAVWRDYCDTIAAPAVRQVLAASIGSVEIDAAQRRRLHDALAVAPRARVAVVTDEALVRGLMTATAWLGRIDLETFSWHKIGEALHHLAPRGVDEQQVVELVNRLRRRAEGAESTR